MWLIVRHSQSLKSISVICSYVPVILTFVVGWSRTVSPDDPSLVLLVGTSLLPILLLLLTISLSLLGAAVWSVDTASGSDITGYICKEYII